VDVFSSHQLFFNIRFVIPVINKTNSNDYNHLIDFLHTHKTTQKINQQSNKETNKD
jgi:hypothetical protein